MPEYSLLTYPHIGASFAAAAKSNFAHLPYTRRAAARQNLPSYPTPSTWRALETALGTTAVVLPAAPITPVVPSLSPSDPTRAEAPGKV
jgi:hypothetical protein